jgi:hypothetical protein
MDYYGSVKLNLNYVTQKIVYYQAVDGLKT